MSNTDKLPDFDPSDKMGRIGDNLGKLADGAKKAVKTLETAANAAADNKGNRWFTLAFWVFLVIAGVICYKVFNNGNAVQNLQQTKLDASTERLLQEKDKQIAELKIEKAELKQINKDLGIENKIKDTTITRNNAKTERLLSIIDMLEKQLQKYNR